MTKEQRELGYLLMDFAHLICPDPKDARLMAAVKNKVGEIVVKVGEIASNEAAETMSSYVNPSSLI